MTTLLEHRPPGGDQIPGWARLDEAHGFLGRFAVFPSGAAHDAVTLWCAHTHAVNAGNASARLAVLSLAPKSGKTRVLELAGLLSHDATQEIDPTGPGLVALIGERQPTILIDETDTIWNTSGNASSAKLRAVLNAGYKQGAFVTRRSGGAYVRDPIYCAVAFGGLGILPETLMSRSIVIQMAGRNGQQIDAYHPRLHTPAGLSIGEALGGWVKSVALDLATAWPELPEGIEDRAGEIWEPLLAIADEAGGDWPMRARSACTELALGVPGQPVMSLGEILLTSLQAIWPQDTDKLPTAEIIRRLFGLEGANWSSLWPPESAPREMAALLSPFGIAPGKIRLGDRTVQGYRRIDLDPFWGVPADVPPGNRG
jgi:hypothetical protein